MRKKLLYILSGIGITLVGISVIWNLKRDEQNFWQQQNSQEVPSQEQQSEKQESQEQESRQTSMEKEEDKSAPQEDLQESTIGMIENTDIVDESVTNTDTQQSETYFPEEFNWADKDISATLFQLMPEKFLFASGAGGWSTVLYLKEDGSFTGRYKDSNTDIVYFCDVSGSFTQPVKIDDYTYSIHIESIEYSEPGQEYDEDNIHYITSKPYGLKNADEILIYIPGYPVSELPQEALGWLNGSSRAFWKPEEPKILSFFALYNVNDKEAFSSEPLWEGEAAH